MVAKSRNLNRIVEIEPFKIKYLARTVLPHIRVERWSRNYNKQIMCDMAYVLPGRVPSLPWYAHWQSSWIYWVPSGQGLGVHLWPISCSYHFGPRLDCLNTHSGSTANVHIIYEPQHDKTKKKKSVHPAKTQISLGIRPVWSESSLCTQWVAKNPRFLHTHS